MSIEKDKDSKNINHPEAMDMNIAKVVARAYAKALAEKGLEPSDLSDAPKKESKPAEAVKHETEDANNMSALAKAYAKALAERGLKPGDPSNISLEEIPAVIEPEPKDVSPAVIELEPEEIPAEDIAVVSDAEPAVIDIDNIETGEETAGEEQEKKAEDSAEDKDAATEEIKAKKQMIAAAEAEPEEKKKKIKGRKALKIKRKPYEKRFKGIALLSKIVDFRDRTQEGIDGAATKMGKDFIIAAHNIANSYSNTRRTIGMALLAVTVVVSGIFILFDRFTVYEYAYNGKVLGYVKEQEEVTDVLEIAGKKLSENSGSNLAVKFVANQNVTFNEVDSGDKVLDTSDSAVNKLVYMTDIETEAYGVYDGVDLVAIVKDNNDAENLLKETQSELSTPDRGMKLVSSEFANQLDIRPLNVLLTSVQDNTSAREQMVNGGEMQIYHIVEEGENAASLQSDFSVGSESIYDETNREIVTEPEQGDKVCIHKTVEPLSVTMVENGRLKEVVEYKTIKKESDEYYKGDTFIEQEGEDGIRIFEGTITKERGEVVKREGSIVDETRKVKNKIILVGTAERPKTAATGTFAMPCQGFVLTSGFGPRWGRAHTGLDMAARTGTPIYASDGGTVITAGYSGGYGLCIDIDHGNGYVTKYGHCSKLLVNVGEKVYQGQQIALMGSTGNSTGPHLHFEVIQNGTRIDPEPILGL